MGVRQRSSALFVAAAAGLAFLAGVGACSSGDDATSPGGVVAYSVALGGAQEVPPVATAATGSASLAVDLDDGAITGSLTFVNLSASATGAPVHLAAAGANGPVIVPLSGGEGMTSGIFTVPGASTLSSAQIESLKAGDLYVNVHSLRHPGGEIRGQITLPPGVGY